MFPRQVSRAHAQRANKGKGGKRDGMGGDEAGGSAGGSAPQK